MHVKDNNEIQGGSQSSLAATNLTSTSNNTGYMTLTSTLFFFLICLFL